jgi:hypothetical protein
MNILFRLTNGEIYNFENYTKFSELIDNLEPDPSIPIDVLDPFTIDDFKKAHFNYLGYCDFKNALNDIKLKTKLWEFEEIKELSGKYTDLNNPVLEWLMVKETNEEKILREKIKNNYYPLNMREIEAEYRIILDCNQFFDYYFLDCERPSYDKRDYGEYDYKFYNALRVASWHGNLEIVKWFIGLGFVNKRDLGDVFVDSCLHNRLENAKWFYDNLPFDSIDFQCIKPETVISSEDDCPNLINYILSNCSSWHNLDILKWMYSLERFKFIFEERINIYVSNSIYKDLGETTEWLISLPEFDKDKFIEERFDNLFLQYIRNDKVEVLQWLHNLLEDKHKPRENVQILFESSCMSSHSMAAKYIYNLCKNKNFGEIDIHANNDELFFTACRYTFYEIVDWFYKLDMDYFDNYMASNKEFKASTSIKPTYFSILKQNILL